MSRVRLIGSLLLCFVLTGSKAQVTGGQYAFEFLRLSNSPHISALGGMNVANPDNDISLALQNPSLMRPGLHNQLGLNYNAYYSGISIANLQYGYHMQKINTSFVFGVQYLNYGSFVHTDDIGNEYGTFRAADFALSLGASRSYGEHWRYGATLKFAHSTLYNSTAAGLATDVGISYYDTATLWCFGATAKNMGFMLKKYTGLDGREPLPFDLQLGVSKRFKHLPLRIFATVHHLYEWDIRYNNPADNEASNLFGATDTSTSTNKYIGDKIFRHFIFGGELSLGKRLLITVAYNHQRRGEMVLKEKTATAGFSFGLGLNLNKLQVHYARSYYSIAGAYNEFGLNLSLNKMMSLGKLGEKIHWRESYPDSWE